MNDDESSNLILAQQSSYAFAGNILSKLLTFIFFAVATRVVSPSLYGTFVLAFSVVMLVVVFANLNLHQSIDYFVPKYVQSKEFGKAKQVIRDIFLITIVTTSATAAVVWMISGLLSDLFKDPYLATVLPVMAIAIPFIAINQTLYTTFYGIKRINLRVVTKDITLPVGKIILGGGLAAAGFGVVGLAGGFVISLALTTAVGAGLLILNIDWIRSARKKSVPRMSIFSYSMPLMFAGAISATVSQIDVFVIGYFMPSSNVGIYRIGQQLASNLLIVLSAVTPVFKPMVAESNNDTEAILNRYQIATRWITIATIPPAITLIIAPEPYLAFLFTPEYAQAGTAVAILSAGYLFNTLLGPEGKVLVGIGHTRITLFNTILLVVSNVLLDVLLVPRYGIIGAAFGTAFSLGVAGVAGVLEIFYLRGIHPYTQALGRAWLLAAIPIMVGIAARMFVGNTLLLAALLPFIVLLSYFSALSLTNSFTNTDSELAARLDEKIGQRIFSRFV